MKQRCTNLFIYYFIAAERQALTAMTKTGDAED